MGFFHNHFDYVGSSDNVMICDICGNDKVLVLKREYSEFKWERVTYYCLDCKVRWTVIERK